MTTLFDSRLSDRDFGSPLLHVGDLLKWMKAKRLHLRTTPPIDGYEFVQVEALLCAIERHANDLTPEQALEIVLNDPVLKNDLILQKYPDDIDPTTCRWLLGAEAHRKWRELLSGAIAAHELTLLDFGSKLPIDTAPAQDPTTSAPALTESAVSDVAPLKQRNQERRILELLKVKGYEALALPSRSPGKPGAKSEIKKLAVLESKLFSSKSFDTAWQRLRDDGDVAGG